MSRSNIEDEFKDDGFLDYLYHRIDDRYESLFDFISWGKTALHLTEVEFKKRQESVPHPDFEYRIDSKVSHFNFQLYF